MPTVTAKQNERIANMIFGSIYPHYLSRIIKNGRTQEELNTIISWLTGYTEDELQEKIDGKITFQQFFDDATLHPNANQIKGLICGYRIEEIEFELTRKARYLDKIVDELAKGRKLEKIMRS